MDHYPYMSLIKYQGFEYNIGAIFGVEQSNLTSLNFYITKLSI